MGGVGGLSTTICSGPASGSCLSDRDCGVEGSSLSLSRAKAGC